ncbi:ABC transporter ATP-binding protein [Frigidibacter sp. RF13]|uniref:ABC transporter ATP-binding protein n=1 Tax=Frigidibacter sp. RF13 TaxID=2997340 RepID=UPI00226E86F4|nr:ABC transporter ATP-binding protein [Frigidibacter sp. RF13]MCY1127291.1 ABC transporter ATP-binding protein [Frigidibacter sp. RF13]
MTGPVLQIDGLTLDYAVPGGRLHALRNVSLSIKKGEVLGIAGESGCGKSTLAAAMIGLTGANARRVAGTIQIDGQDMEALTEDDRRRLRGRKIAMVFQDPMTAFNPVLTIGAQLTDFQHNIDGVSRAEKRARAEAMLSRVGLADPGLIMGRYPHELSGGMRQRAAIAAALLLQPEVLIADEPTTALDVTMEAQIIHLFRELRDDYDGAMVIVTHHLGVIAELCDRVAIMYAGEVVEEGPVDAIYHRARHPYTRALMACDPAMIVARTARLPTIGGALPDLRAPPPGCAFAPRCPLVTGRCRTDAPPDVQLTPGHRALCHEVRP